MKEKWIVEYIFNAFDIYSHRKKNLLNYAFLSNKKKKFIAYQYKKSKGILSCSWKLLVA